MPYEVVLVFRDVEPGQSKGIGPRFHPSVYCRDGSAIPDSAAERNSSLVPVWVESGVRIGEMQNRSPEFFLDFSLRLTHFPFRFRFSHKRNIGVSQRVSAHNMARLMQPSSLVPVHHQFSSVGKWFDLQIMLDHVDGVQLGCSRQL